jgi:signal peptidase II
MNLHTMPFPPKNRTRDHRLALFLLSALVVLADRVSKLWIVHHIPSGSGRVVIPGVFRITHVLNSGAAFSIFADSVSPNAVRYGLIAFSVVAVLIVLAMLWRAGRYLNASTIALALILGGAIGNLYDRARLYYVVDFLEVTIFHYHWPDFNVADSCIVIGACLLLLEIFRPQPTNS